MKNIQIEVEEKNLEVLTLILQNLKPGLIHSIKCDGGCEQKIDAHGLNVSHEHKEKVKDSISNIEHHIQLLSKAVHKL
jgi:hypothetical protein